jgi:hypothetical protein
MSNMQGEIDVIRKKEFSQVRRALTCLIYRLRACRAFKLPRICVGARFSCACSRSLSLGPAAQRFPGSSALVLSHAALSFALRRTEA